LSARLVAYASCFVLAVCSASASQERDYMSDLATSRMILNVLRKGGTSGSLEYWTQCRAPQVLPQLPTVRTLPDNSKPIPVTELQEMLIDDPGMHVTEDTDGTVRMVESVPEDLLNVTISHISFPEVYEARRAQGFILAAPEVKSFMKNHGIAWLPIGSPLGLFTIPSPEMPHISGDLNNVTVRQALDYVLKTFPGFWVYQSCSDEAHNRVSIHFFTYAAR
jgi:hypothetical protein